MKSTRKQRERVAREYEQLRKRQGAAAGASRVCSKQLSTEGKTR